MSTTPKVAVIAKLPAKPGQRDQLAEAFKAAIANAESEEGTLSYILLADFGDENALWVYETYTDEAALIAHSTSDAFKAIGGGLAPFMGGRPEIIRLTPLAGKGL